MNTVLKPSRNASDENADSPRYTAPALEKGLDILDVLVDTAEGYTLNELSVKLGRTVSEIFRMVVTLERRGYVQGDHNDRYTLTLKLFEMAHRQQPIRSLTAMALPLLRDLANMTRQSCHLSIYNSGRVAVIAQVDSPERWSFGLKVGAVMGLTDTSSGHVLLAFRDIAERERMLAAHTRVEGENDVEPAVLLALLDEIRAAGHEIVPSRQMRGVTNVAFPVIGSSGDAIAAVNVPYLERIDKKVNPEFDEVCRMVGEMAGRLSAFMGFSGYNLEGE
ncbi:IclR family transcriptional regulator [Caballeronia mineralivorans PML1(12)]|uniref:IclR family transcriptional regulator n=1 Tax=Caballeronia mineralivorans PML1(12) TaxID=908627 RepID=A0A0J1CZ17_9BURK|nr:IclR family transcriptional regulator [Caballeronia mineralivorans]KLU25769.1 IclR family transcriptional regulator [Caballeronia mineralivorans PML1(12)]